MRHQTTKRTFGAADVLGNNNGNIISRAGHDRLDRILDVDRGAGADAELRRFHRCGMGGHLQRRVEAHPPGFKLLEQQIERHDLGEGRRMAQRIRIGRVHDPA